MRSAPSPLLPNQWLVVRVLANWEQARSFNILCSSGHTIVTPRILSTECGGNLFLIALKGEGEIAATNLMCIGKSKI